MLPSPCFGEKSIEGIVTTANSFIAGHLAIWLNAVLQTKKLPACIADLDAGLADVDAKSLTHLELSLDSNYEWPRDEANSGLHRLESCLKRLSQNGPGDAMRSLSKLQALPCDRAFGP
jgi:hypothetical protein